MCVCIRQTDGTANSSLLLFTFRPWGMCSCAQGGLKWNAYITLRRLIGWNWFVLRKITFPHNAHSPTRWRLHTWVTQTWVWVYECSKLTDTKTHTHIHPNMWLCASVNWNIGVQNCIHENVQVHPLAFSSGLGQICILDHTLPDKQRC